MPGAHAHAHEDDQSGAGGASPEERPILLADIDRVLGESAVVERLRGRPPIRVWRDELTLARESLAYAREILAADVAILRRCLAGNEAADLQAVVGELPTVVAAHPWGEGWSGPREIEDLGEIDLGVFARSDRLVAAHEKMASADLSSPEDLSRLLAEFEAQLTELTERQQAVERRLQQIRAAIVLQYQEGGIPAVRDWLG